MAYYEGMVNDLSTGCCNNNNGGFMNGDGW